MLAKGVSSFGSSKLNPSGSASLAYAQAASPPTQPANNASRFGEHTSHGRWSHDLNGAKIANFTQLVQKASSATHM